MGARVRRLTSLFTLMFRPSEKIVGASTLHQRTPALRVTDRTTGEGVVDERTRPGAGEPNPGAVVRHGTTEGHDVPSVIGVFDGAPLAVNGRVSGARQRLRPSAAAGGRIGHRHLAAGLPVQRADGTARTTSEKRALLFSSSGRSTRYASGGAPPTDPASLYRSASSSTPPRTRPQHHPNPVGGDCHPGPCS